MSVVVAFTGKLEVCTVRHDPIAPKPGLDFDHQMWPRDMAYDLRELHLQQIHIGWRT
jgi:hypothetical protein